MSTTATKPRQLALDFNGPEVNESVLNLSGGCFLVDPATGGPLELRRGTELHVQVIDVDTGEVVGNAYGRVLKKGTVDKELRETDDEGRHLIHSRLVHGAKVT